MYWQEWFKSIIILVILLGILESFLPKGELAKFSKLVFGLALMLALLQPLIIILNKDLNDVDWVWSESFYTEPNFQVITERLQVAAIKPFVETEQKDLIWQIERFIIDLDGLDAVRVYLNQDEQNEFLIHVFVSPFSLKLTAQISQAVASLLNISSKYVLVQELVE